MTDDQIERVARAICYAEGYCAGGCQEKHGRCIALTESLIGEYGTKRNQARAAIAAASEWLPIESAPKDGREALVYRPLADRTHDPKVTIARLIKTDNWCHPSTIPDGATPCNPTDRSCHVTHWQPMPQPPKVTT